MNNRCRLNNRISNNKITNYRIIKKLFQIIIIMIFKTISNKNKIKSTEGLYRVYWNTKKVKLLNILGEMV